ncbi:GDP-L-fucose synthase [Ketogulonicigenium robustum]|uniref:GDP-L-fucose synthase n=1 Tax=Ketogulonicigenium robustum TaxID=92947 RepID=A0A1W6NYQ5_9RHOB|nr:GDP-L-fucose synthase [Ketogulonicigenium robustum]ARO14230.1 GDP-L-fucose synthase [Ketogulonicigenium robustum]
MQRIFLAGAGGLVGAAILRALQAADKAFTVFAPTRADLDLTRQADVAAYFAATRPDTVIIAAGRVGGIAANLTQPACFIYDNMMIAANIIHAAYGSGVGRLINLGSSCIYPRDAPQPLREEMLLAGPLDASNAPYAVAKIAAITLCAAYHRQYGADFRSLMPASLYGAGDNFHLTESHVIPALIRRLHSARAQGESEVDIWGDGSALREFMHADDLAAAVLFTLGLDAESYWNATGPTLAHLNAGTGKEVSIRALARIIADKVGYMGTLRFDEAQPSGVCRRVMDSSRLRSLGWAPRIELAEGLEKTVDWFGKRANLADFRGAAPRAG